MARFFTLAFTVLMAGVFAWGVPLDRLFGAIQPLIVAFSIMVAAVFVRLNRGMPTLEWKSLEPARRKQLTTSILSLAVEYGWIIGINAVALAGLLAISVIGVDIACSWPGWGRRLVAGIVGGVVALCTARMAYVVWRDIDIVRLQKSLIDDLAEAEATKADIDSAEKKVATMRSAGIRTVPVQPPKAWNE